jgi:hypothetical protein
VKSFYLRDPQQQQIEIQKQEDRGRGKPLSKKGKNAKENQHQNWQHPSKTKGTKEAPEKRPDATPP